MSDCQAKCSQNFEQRDKTINIKGLCEPTCECKVAVQWAGIFISLFLLAIIKSKAPVSQLVKADDTSVIEIKTATDTSLEAKSKLSCHVNAL